MANTVNQADPSAVLVFLDFYADSRLPLWLRAPHILVANKIVMLGWLAKPPSLAEDINTKSITSLSVASASSLSTRDVVKRAHVSPVFNALTSWFAQFSLPSWGFKQVCKHVLGFRASGQNGFFGYLYFFSPAVFIKLYFYNQSENLCVTIEHGCEMSVQECLMRMSPPAVVPQVLPDTLVKLPSV